MLDFLKGFSINYVNQIEIIVIIAIIVFALYIFFSLNLFKKG